MDNALRSMFIFVAGLAVGSIATYKLVEEKFARRAQEEIDSVKEVYLSKKEVYPEEQNTEEQIVEQNKITSRLGYVDYSDISNKTMVEEGEIVDRPYVIAPEDFGELGDYEQISLTYYVDGVLADDMDELVEDVEDVIGFGSLNHFGEYEDDSVFVRNDRLKADYEILADPRKYSEVVKNGPRRVEEE